MCVYYVNSLKYILSVDHLISRTSSVKSSLSCLYTVPGHVKYVEADMITIQAEHVQKVAADLRTGLEPPGGFDSFDTDFLRRKQLPLDIAGGLEVGEIVQLCAEDPRLPLAGKQVLVTSD